MAKRAAGRTTKRIQPPKDVFFERELGGEPPLRRQTAERLLTVAHTVGDAQPWRYMEETDVVFVHHPDSSEPDMCSVMGAAHGLHGIGVYPGFDGIRHWKRMQESRALTSTIFFETNRSFRVAFEDLSELLPPDRDLLRRTGFLPESGRLAIRLESYRPCYLPWYISEPEAQRLEWSLIAMQAIAATVAKNPELDFWQDPGTYPSVVIEQLPAGGLDIRIKPTEPPEVPKVVEEIHSLDAVDVASVSQLKTLPKFTLQVGFFVLPMPIGRQHERKMCMRLAFAADAASGFVFPPKAEAPDVPATAMVCRGAIEALRSAGVLPAAIQVAEQRFAQALAPLASEHGIPIHVVESLAALEACVDAMRHGM